MKIGLLTFTDGTNIGQRLQNYALQTVLENEGHRVYTIKQGYPFNLTKKRVKEIINICLHFQHEYKIILRQRKFTDFNSKYIKFYDKELSFWGSNSWISDQFDSFIVGSDQIWNPYSPFVGDNFFLTFTEPSKRMTYAPSFSVDSIPQEKRERYVEYLNGFSNITIREDKGAEIVEMLTGKTAEVVLDPTFLLEKKDWDKIKKKYEKRPENKYMLAMFLGDYPKEDIEKIEKNLDIPVLRVDSNAKISPDEFLDLAEHAEVVLTDSFHITVFSVLYHRPFVNFIRSGSGASMNSRFATLYRLLGIENREWVYVEKHMQKILEMQYEGIDRKIREERIRCLEILRRELEKVSNSR